MTVALIKDTKHINNPPQTADSAIIHGGPGNGAPPGIMEQYRSAQKVSAFFNLPEELTDLVVSNSGKDVFNLGLTCKYWNLKVRTYLTEVRQGIRVLRQKNEETFRSEHRMSVVNACREVASTAHQKFFDFDAALAKELKDTKDPVDLVPPSKGYWMTPDLKSALAGRGGRLTIFNMDAPDDGCARSIIEAINAIPSNGFVALCISSATLSSPKAAEIWGAISSHPVVEHIECFGDNNLSTGDTVVEWIKMLSRKNANVSSFSLSNCRLDEQSCDTLLKLLADETGINELEICEVETSVENASNLFAAVRTRNASADTKLALHFAASNLNDLITAADRSVLQNDGIYIRSPGQIWAIQLDPVEEVPVREDSGDDDSSSVVGDPSSGDEGWGSEFSRSDADSDAVVESLSEAED